MIQRQILIIEDDPAMGESLVRGIDAEGYRAVLFTNGVDALIAVGREQYAAAVVDVMLPGMSGFEICRRIRESGSTVPLLLLTARDAIDDRVMGLDSGADDYLTKPFSFAELAARIRALLRRDPSEQWVKVSAGDVTMDSQARKATVCTRPLPLSPNEFLILRGLLVKEGVPWSKDDILESVWGTSEHITANIVEQYISTIRKKLATRHSSVTIETVRGVGYLIRVAQ